MKLFLLLGAAALTLARAETVDELCPCEPTEPTEPWEDHGAYVSCVANATKTLDIPKQERKAYVKAAAQSDCGKTEGEESLESEESEEPLESEESEEPLESEESEESLESEESEDSGDGRNCGKVKKENQCNRKWDGACKWEGGNCVEKDDGPGIFIPVPATAPSPPAPFSKQDVDFEDVNSGYAVGSRHALVLASVMAFLYQ